jgi:4-hydroxy-tetrahydrodipicolinate synthase
LAANGDAMARHRAQELSEAFEVLSTYDEGADLVLYYKYLMVLEGNPEYALHFNPTDALSPSQAGFAKAQLQQFKAWYAKWSTEA